jgi:RNA polymerase sigma-70 factor (ECF subfamily)
VRRVSRAVTGDDHDADDAAQDAFLSALDRIETYDRRRPFGPWLMRIASNAAIDLLRRRKVRQAELIDDRVATAGPSPAVETERAEIRSRLQAALATLPERQRIAITLFDLEGYPHAEIATVLGVPEGTVRSDVFHARRTLRTALRAFAPGADDVDEEEG